MFYISYNISLVLCVCFVDRCLSFCTFTFGHCVVCPSSIHDSDYSFGIFNLFLDVVINSMLCLGIHSNDLLAGMI